MTVMNLARPVESVVCFSTELWSMSEVGSMNFDHAMSVLPLRFFRA